MKKKKVVHFTVAVGMLNISQSTSSFSVSGMFFAKSFFFFLKGKNTFYIFRQIFLFINLFSGIFYRNFLVFLHFCFQKVSKESKLFKLKIFLENIFFVENFNNFLPSTLYSLCSSDTFFKSNQCHLSLPKKKKSKNFFSISRVTRQYSFFPNQSLLLIPSVRSSLK